MLLNIIFVVIKMSVVDMTKRIHALHFVIFQSFFHNTPLYRICNTIYWNNMCLCVVCRDLLNFAFTFLQQQLVVILLALTDFNYQAFSIFAYQSKLFYLLFVNIFLSISNDQDYYLSASQPRYEVLVIYVQQQRLSAINLNQLKVNRSFCVCYVVCVAQYLY